MTTTTLPAAFPDDPTAFDHDQRVTQTGPGRYTVLEPGGTVQYVFATADHGWVVANDPELLNGNLGNGVVAGFADGDQAIETALRFAAVRANR